MAGPMMKPRPKATPINPMALARSSGAVKSAMAAWATEILAPMIPATVRPMKSMLRLAASP